MLWYFDGCFFVEMGCCLVLCLNFYVDYFIIVGFVCFVMIGDVCDFIDWFV